MAPSSPLHDEYALAAEGMSATACKAALSRLRDLCNDNQARGALEELHHLTAYSRRVTACLEAGEEALEGSDTDSAALEWARALVLMNAMAVEASGGRARSAFAAPAHQKVGNTG